MKAFSHLRLLVAGLGLALAAASTPTNAFANLMTPYICADSNELDATSQFVTSNNVVALQVTTAANGENSAGIELSSIAGNPVFQSLTFNLSGPASSTEGPFVTIMGTDSKGNPATLTMPYGTDKLARRGHGGLLTLSYQAKASPVDRKNRTLPSNNGIKVNQIIVAFYPNSKSNQYTLSSFQINGAPLTAVMKTLLDCPVGYSHP